MEVLLEAGQAGVVSGILDHQGFFFHRQTFGDGEFVHVTLFL